ncbi:molybdate ABC transporter substrate-binding protein [Halothiobacillus diazotrophicus]|uniref:Molybdate ABC transporter substrate-binding protein n=1 Tax=Halothiobacillus diazotrophicus TaxID=1860122 RepID=A0A191ZH83_9GAMM|nr:molybdate ABC transporter substrate-binding protein [Halothiobacillus diazotrophicus]ANJ67225.1 molybdate ABC transporter substrate-binding protein [Halothiobacillus diazotrophicus]
MNKSFATVLCTIFLFTASLSAARADTITVAVAANFTKAAEEIGAAWHKETGNTVRFSFGPTGGLFAQINNGAPFDAFLAADTRRPALLVKVGKATDDFVYAQGTIALYSRTLPVAADHDRVLKSGDFAHLAIANPKSAPYGAAAVAVMQKLGVYPTLKQQGKIVDGESIAATFQFVMTGNAQLGFVALSQLADPASPAKGIGQYWVPPQSDYPPIEQAAVLIKDSPHADAARNFLTFLRSPAATKIIQHYGYALPTPGKPG